MKSNIIYTKRLDYHGNKLKLRDRVKLKNPYQFGIKDNNTYIIFQFYDNDTRVELIDESNRQWMIVKCTETVKVGDNY